MASPQVVAISVLSAGVIALVSAIPTAIIANPWYTRMTPVYADQYFFWIATSIVAGTLIGTYFTPLSKRTGAARGLGGGFLSYLAIGCPICNKVIVGLIGVSGALDYFAPIQPVLGALGLLLASAALLYRIRDLRRGYCPIV